MNNNHKKIKQIINKIAIKDEEYIDLNLQKIIKDYNKDKDSISEEELKKLKEAISVNSELSSQIKDQKVSGKESSSESYQAPLKGKWECSGGFSSSPSPGHPGGHYGVDMRAPIGTPIYPLTSGKVSEVAVNSGKGGNTIRVDHPGGITSYYAHLSTIKVKVGQEVDKNTIIGTVGKTGNAEGTWPHLHFGVRDAATKGSWKDPAKYFTVPSYKELTQEEKKQGMYLSDAASKEDSEFREFAKKRQKDPNVLMPGIKENASPDSKVASIETKYKIASRYFSKIFK